MFTRKILYPVYPVAMFNDTNKKSPEQQSDDSRDQKLSDMYGPNTPSHNLQGPNHQGPDLQGPDLQGRDPHRPDAHPHQSTRRYSIIIPAWNESQHIQQTIESVLEAQAEQALSGDIIVVDNNSSDDTAAKAAALGAKVEYEPVNQIARARNTGAAAASADFLIFLDADTTINAALLKLTLDTLLSGDTIGGGSTMTLDRELKGTAKLVVNFWNWLSRSINVAAGCYLFCTREVFVSVGGFDEKHYAAEELVLSRKLKKYAKTHSKSFVILDQAPVVSSARKLDWYSGRQKLGQLLLLLIPGATRSKRMLGMWYDRSQIRDTSDTRNPDPE